MHERRAIIHSNTPRAARTVLTEIAKLRSDIHQIALTLTEIELNIAILAQELRALNEARMPRYTPADSE